MVILVVEADASLRRLIAHILQPTAQRVLTAESGTDALRISRDFAGEIRLVIVPAELPLSKAGRGPIQQIAAERPSAVWLFLADYVPDDERSTTVLEKPFRAAELRNKVQRLLQGKAGE